MDGVRATRSFIERYPFDYSDNSWKRAADAAMMRPPLDLERNCSMIRDFISSIDRPPTDGMIRNWDEVRHVLSTHDRPWLGLSQPSPNGRFLFTYKYFPTSNKLELAREMFVTFENGDQLHRVASYACGIKHFRSNLDHPFYPRQWFYSTDQHVCFALHADSVEYAYMDVHNSIYLIAPRVRR